MTAISAPRATASCEVANRFPAGSTAAEVRLPGTDRTYEIRDVLHGVSLRWDPATHTWHGRLR